MRLACLLPAAGASTRMRGADKLLEDVNGQPCLAVMASRAQAAGFEVIVTLPNASHPRAKTLSTLNVMQISVADAQLGLSHSLRLGVACAAQFAEGLMILPADMPALTVDDLARLSAEFHAHPKNIIQATTQSGKPGHPVMFPSDLFKGFETLSGDFGAAALIRSNINRVRAVKLAGCRARLDLDTPEDWAKWRASGPLG